MSFGLMTTMTRPGRKPAGGYSGPGGRKTGAMVLLGAGLTAVLQISATGAAQAADPAPAVSPVAGSALWAMSVDPDALTLQKSILMTTGLVHSDGGLHILRAKGSLTGGTEYGGTYWAKTTNIKVAPAAVRTDPAWAHRYTLRSPTTGPVGPRRWPPPSTSRSTRPNASATTGRPT